MKNYYYEENGLQLGPFKIEELKGKITHKTKVWTEGLSDWVEASKIPDLREILSLSTPPPLNKTKKKSILKIGIFLIFLIILIIFILKYNPPPHQTMARTHIPQDLHQPVLPPPDL